jgi:hypothetical protein
MNMRCEYKWVCNFLEREVLPLSQYSRILSKCEVWKNDIWFFFFFLVVWTPQHSPHPMNRSRNIRIFTKFLISSNKIHTYKHDIHCYENYCHVWYYASYKSPVEMQIYVRLHGVTSRKKSNIHNHIHNSPKYRPYYHIFSDNISLW